MPRLKAFACWGSSGHAKVLSEIVEYNQGRIVALFDNNKHANSCFSGVPLYFGEDGFNDWNDSRNKSEKVYAILAIGGDRGNDRERIGQFMEKNGIPPCNLIHPSASVSKSVFLGKGTQILANTVVAAGVQIGNYGIVNNSANIDHECILGTGVHVAPGAVLCGKIEVGDYSMIGAGATILPRLKIGNRVIVGAGAVVCKDVPDQSIVYGNPARFMRANSD